MKKPVRILFVCLGNICRSPTAEGAFRKMIVGTPLENEVEIESAATHDYQVGAAPDARSIDHAARRGVDLTAIRARQIVTSDFRQYDYVLAMDENNVEHLRAMAPDQYANKIELFLNYARNTTQNQTRLEVPDPYMGTAKDFERVLDLVEDGCAGLIRHLLDTTSKSAPKAKS
jgi:protein-tyrosine phosphatase